MTTNISGVSVTSPDGTTKSLGDYAGKVLLIVNVASKCGFTKQYAGLQALNEAYADKGLACSVSLATISAVRNQEPW